MRKASRTGTGNAPNIIIKKEEVVVGESHGGAWKVAYADFVTAMMAFFLLMWLLNATTEDQRKGLADYFSPNSLLSHASSGTGQPFGGHTAFDQGALVSDRGAVQVLVGSRPTTTDPTDAEEQPYAPVHGGADEDQDQNVSQPATPLNPSPTPATPTGTAAPVRATIAQPPGTTPPQLVPANPAGAAQPHEQAAAATLAGQAHEQAAAAALAAQGHGQSTAATLATQPQAQTVAAMLAAQPRAPTEAEMLAAQQRAEKAEFAQAAQQIRDAVRSDPALLGLAHQLAIDITPEGLRIQILDADRQPMFPFGSSTPNDRAKLLLQKVTPVLEKLSQDISIAGYTDSAPFPGPDRTNWELSAERANATRRLLVEGGLPDSRIRSVTGNADRDPLIPSDPLAAANRRIAIVVLRAALAAAPVPGAADAGSGTAGAAGGRAMGAAAAGAQDNTAGGSTAQGNTAGGGNTAGHNTAGGNTAGGNTAGGNTAGGNTAGGNTAGGNASGSKPSGAAMGGGSPAPGVAGTPGR